ncbi:hypothetical protein ACFV98_02615 [Streptomyces violascens]|uniref:hypothetical protein n=1 Tax=Streptomyces violascens TaxID=67381 RepID=UPI003660E1D1
MASKKVRARSINVEDVSSVGIAGLVSAVGFNIGTDTWLGKCVVWSSLILVLLLPPLIAATLNVVNDKLKYWQWSGLRKRLQLMLDKTDDPEARRLIEAEIKKADLELAKTLIESMRGIHAETAET